MSDEEDEINENLIESYAKAKGIPVEKARKELLPILAERRPSTFDVRSEKLMQAVELLGKIGEIQQNVDPTTARILGTVATGVVASAMGQQGGGKEDIDDKIFRKVYSLKAYDKLKEAMGVGDVDALRKEFAELRKELTDKRKAEELERVEAKIEELVSPLHKRLEALEKREEPTPPPPPLTVGDVMNQVNKLTEEAKTWLTHAGYKVEMDKGLSREEVQKMIEEAQKATLEKLPPEQLSERLKGMGYTIVGGPIPHDVAQKMAQEAYERGKEEALDDKRVEATAKVIEAAVAQIVQAFSPAIQQIVASSLVQQELGGEGASRGQQGSQEKQASQQ